MRFHEQRDFFGRLGVSPEFLYLLACHEDFNDPDLREAAMEYRRFLSKMNTYQEDLEKKYAKELKEIEVELDPFIRDKFLHMGLGLESEYKVNKIHQYLDNAFGMVSGIQQSHDDHGGADRQVIKSILKRIKQLCKIWN